MSNGSKRFLTSQPAKAKNAKRSFFPREVDNIIGETEEATLTRDAALPPRLREVEHYEIATYGGLVQLAITRDLHEAADLLDKTLVEEEDNDVGSPRDRRE